MKNGHDSGRWPAPAGQDQPSGGQSCERMRAFVAVTTSTDLHKVCNTLAEEGNGLFMRWVRPESVHLTLRFWGDLKADAVPAVCEGLQRAAQASAPFLAAVRGLGCFPSTDRPRVLWMGLVDPQRQLLHLRQRIDESLAAVGVTAEEKPFRPHLTVARARRAPGRGKLDAFLESHKNQTFGHVAVSGYHLMRSDLSGKGAVHTRLHSFPLQGDKFAAQSPLGATGDGDNGYP